MSKFFKHGNWVVWVIVVCSYIPVGGIWYFNGYNEARLSYNSKLFSPPSNDVSISKCYTTSSIKAAILCRTQELDSERGGTVVAKQLALSKEANLWGKYGVYAALFATMVTGLGLLLLWRTLVHASEAARHTELMLKESEETTNAARRQIEIAVEVGANQQLMREDNARAYLKVLIERFEWNKKLKKSVINWKVQNFGKSEARTIRHITRTFVLDTPLDVAGLKTLSFVESDADLWAANMYPDEETFSASDFELLSSELFADVVTGKKGLFFAGMITYKDVFRRKHFTQFSYQCNFDPKTGTLDGFSRSYTHNLSS